MCETCGTDGEGDAHQRLMKAFGSRSRCVAQPLPEKASDLVPSAERMFSTRPYDCAPEARKAPGRRRQRQKRRGKKRGKDDEGAASDSCCTRPAAVAVVVVGGEEKSRKKARGAGCKKTEERRLGRLFAAGKLSAARV